MADIRKLTPGQIVYDRHRHSVGNVRGMTEMGEWRVQIVEVDPEFRFVVASWNGNKARAFYPSTVRKWKLKPYKPRATPPDAGGPA